MLTLQSLISQSSAPSQLCWSEIGHQKNQAYVINYTIEKTRALVSRTNQIGYKSNCHDI